MKITLAASLLLAIVAAAPAMAQAPAPDNTKTNAVPANSAMKASIADGQSNGQSDVKITQQIRKSVMADKSLSTSAHNVKIVSVNGMVTLNGVVKNDQEKSAIEEKAQAVVGKANVTNELKTAP